MSRIEVIDYKKAEGDLKTIYDDLIKSRGKLANVHTIQSLRPNSIKAHMNLYMEIMFSKSELKRWKREMIATVVSVENGCDYCTKHHSEALNHYWKDSEKIKKLINGEFDKILDYNDIALCLFAQHLTKNPEEHQDTDYSKKLKELGYSDSTILDTVLVIAYFNFVNRIVLSLGLEIEEDGGVDYVY
jgi:uncharacterized peroxidase-related enzyme